MADTPQGSNRHLLMKEQPLQQHHARRAVNRKEKTKRTSTDRLTLSTHRFVNSSWSHCGATAQSTKQNVTYIAVGVWASLARFHGWLGDTTGWKRIGEDTCKAPCMIDVNSLQFTTSKPQFPPQDRLLPAQQPQLKSKRWGGEPAQQVPLQHDLRETWVRSRPVLGTTGDLYNSMLCIIIMFDSNPENKKVRSTPLI